MAERSTLPWSRDPSDRLSYIATLKIRPPQIATASIDDKTRLNLWQDTQLADTKATIRLPAFLKQRGVESVDFIKIDVDGTDYEILQDMEDDLTRWQVLGVQVEINYYGSDSVGDHTLHNVDRLMKRAGFELMDIDQRRYSVSALPSRYLIGIPAQTESGRVYQGDAVYIRDLAQDDWSEFASLVSSDKLIKLAVIFSLYGLFDCAAEILVKFRERLGQFPVNTGLDVLAAQAQGYRSDGLSYADYMDRFNRDDQMFYVQPIEASGVEGKEVDTEAHLLSDARGEIIRLHQEIGRLKHELITQERALIDLTERLIYVERETAARRERQSEVLGVNFEECWNARSWQLFSPIRNVFRRLQGTTQEEKPAIYSAEEAERWIRAIRESTSWELLGPLRALNRIRQRFSSRPSPTSPRASGIEEGTEANPPTVL
jgi:hypothetical protein